MNDQTTTIRELKDAVADFVEARDWRQFHDPKNLAMSIAIETAELMEHFQCLRSDQVSPDAWSDETRQDIADRKEEWGEESALYIGSVLGKFPDNLDDSVVPLWAATEAASREMEPDGSLVGACDVARFGHDKTVVMSRQGPVARIVWRVRGRDTMEIAGFLSSYCREHAVETLVVDDTGVGGGVVDRLKEVRPGNTRVLPFISGQKAESPDRFANRIAEVWWAMRNRFLARELDTDNDDALIGQLSSRRYSHISDGRIRLESKQRMYRSPDEADALAMTFAATRGGVKIWV